MAEKENKYEDNVDGKYYVDDECIDCNLCRELAPENFKANEAEKASNITVVDVKGGGAFGRLTLAGREGDVEEAAAAAIRAIEEISNY